MFWLDIALGMDARGFLLLEHARRETDMMDENDRKYMMMAMDEAEKGVGLVSPNPMVGAVIVRDGRVIGKGHHRKYGGLHAEREALEDCKSRGETPAGAVMYVTLEPCCHYGKQPPCTEAIIDAGIARVVAGMGDPNPLVCGKGLRILQEAGIETECGLCENELREQNRVFLKYIVTGRPWVALKYAMTADGKIRITVKKSAVKLPKAVYETKTEVVHPSKLAYRKDRNEKRFTSSPRYSAHSSDSDMGGGTFADFLKQAEERRSRDSRKRK